MKQTNAKQLKKTKKLKKNNIMKPSQKPLTTLKQNHGQPVKQLLKTNKKQYNILKNHKTTLKNNKKQ